MHYIKRNNHNASAYKESLGVVTIRNEENVEISADIHYQAENRRAPADGVHSPACYYYATAAVVTWF